MLTPAGDRPNQIPTQIATAPRPFPEFTIAVVRELLMAAGISNAQSLDPLDTKPAVTAKLA
jgi:hypothetical protein